MLLLVAGCFTPRVAPGAPCGPDEACPSGLACIAGTCLPPGTIVPADAADPADASDASADAATPDATPDAFVDPSLIAHWEFDDDPADGALDSSGRGHTATCLAACPAQVTGKIGMAYQFSSAQAHALVVADHADFRGAFTLAAWMRASTVGSNMAILSKPFGTGSGNSWQLELRDTGALSFSGGSAHYLDNPTTTATNVWHHVAGTWDGTTKRLYVDGVLVASVASAIDYDTHPIFLGADENSGSTVLYWNGTLDDLRIYNRVLTVQEIQALAP
jgi:hypothetical protein